MLTSIINKLHLWIGYDKDNRVDSIILFVFFISASLGVAISYSKLYLFHISLFILIGLFLLRFLKLTNPFRYVRERVSRHKIFLFVFIWGIFSVIWSYDRSSAIKHSIILLMSYSIVFAMTEYATSIKRLKRIFYWIAPVYLLNLITGLLESTTSFRYPISNLSRLAPFFGRSFSNEFKDIWHIKPDQTYLEMMTWPTGFEWSTNNFAVVLTIVLPFFLFYKKGLVKICGSLCCIFLVIMAGARISLITVGIMLCVYIFVFLFRSIKQKIVILLSSFMSIFILIIMVYNISNIGKMKIDGYLLTFSEILKIHKTSVEYVTTKSTQKRWDRIKHTWKAFVDSRGVGVGAGNSGKKIFHPYSKKDVSVHFFWLELLCDYGFVLFFIIIVSCLFLLIKLRQIYLSNKKGFEKYLASSCFVSLLCFSIGTISTSSTFYMLSMWILIAFSFSLINLKKSTISNILR